MLHSKITIVLLFTFLSTLCGQSFRTQPLSPYIYTIQVNTEKDWTKEPIITLHSTESVNVVFDCISDNISNRLRYKIIHCDADWNESKAISEIDYLNGFNDNRIENYSASVNTTVEYTNFSLTIPNEDVTLKIAGNYTIQVYEEDNPSLMLLTACFSVLDPKMAIAISVSSKTDVDADKEHQQVSFTLNHALNIRDVLGELKVYVRKNNQLWSERKNLKPSSITANKLVYDHNRELIFEAGNEYRRFETASYRHNGMNVAHIDYSTPYYNMYISPNYIRANKSYSYDQDQNGRFFIRNTDTDNSNTEADYFVTRFSLVAEEPLPFPVYINGYFTNNTLDEQYEMKYDFDAKEYQLALLLKQGLYNYQYITTNQANKYSTAHTEGNYSDAENEYAVWVYYRPLGQLYDSLIGQNSIQSRKK